MSGEKTEKPTQKKLEQAAEKGQTANRKNMVEGVVVTSGILMIFMSLESYWDKFSALFAAIYNNLDSDFFFTVMMVRRPFMAILELSVSLALAMGILALMSNLLLNKFNFAIKALSPKFEKFNPVNTAKGIFSMTTVYNFLRMLVLFCLIATILTITMMTSVDEVLAAAYCGLSCISEVGPTLIVMFLSLTIFAILILAAADFRIQNMLHTKQNKMSKDDVKQERKGQDGDPHVKGKRKSLAREDAVMPSPKDATHLVYGNGYAVALIYRENVGMLPYIVAKYRTKDIGRLAKLYSGFGVPVAHIGDIAEKFHKRYNIFSEADARSAEGVARIMAAVGQLQSEDSNEAPDE